MNVGVYVVDNGFILLLLARLSVANFNFLVLFKNNFSLVLLYTDKFGLLG